MNNWRRKTDGKTPKKLWRAFIALGLFTNLYLLLSFFVGEMGFLNATKMRAVYVSVQTEVSSLKTENEKLLNQIDLLQHDPATIEQFARDRLGLVRNGELIYEFIESHTP